MKTQHYIIIAIALFVFAWWYWRKKNSNMEDVIIPPIQDITDTPIPGDGRTPFDNGITGLGIGNTSIAPVNVVFEDFTAMRYIANDGRRPTIGGSRKMRDPLFNSTGFLVRQNVNLSMFKVGEPVKISATANEPNPHYQTGIFTLKAKIPAIPGVGSQIRGTWIVTDSGWTPGSSAPERGLLQAL